MFKTATFMFATAALLSNAALAQVPYITGGIGKQEREMILAQKPNYNFELRVALKTGHFVSDVELLITDAEGNEKLKTLTEGPYFFAKLDAGKYQIQTDYKGQSVRKAFTIVAGQRMREVIVHFNGNEEIVD